MSQLMQTTSWPIDTRGVYLIRVLGALDATWLDYFEGLSIVVRTLSDLSSISTLCAHDADQTELIGILNSLYNSHLLIVSVECLDSAAIH